MNGGPTMERGIHSAHLPNSQRREKGSLALEQVLFIAAIVAMSAGLFVFYDNLRTYFAGFDINAVAGNAVPHSSPTEKTP